MQIKENKTTTKKRVEPKKCRFETLKTKKEKKKTETENEKENEK